MKVSTHALVVVALCAGCIEVELSAMHPPVPGAMMEVDREDRRIELSSGTALALECTYSTDPCTNLEVTGYDAEIATVYPLHIDGLGAPSFDGDQVRSGFVLVGTGVGVTEVEITSSEGEKIYEVEIVPTEPTK